MDRAYELGAVAARMTGGGFGGSIVALVPRDAAEAFAAEVAEAVPTAHGFGTRAARGAHEL